MFIFGNQTVLLLVNTRRYIYLTKIYQVNILFTTLFSVHSSVPYFLSNDSNITKQTVILSKTSKLQDYDCHV